MTANPLDNNMMPKWNLELNHLVPNATAEQNEAIDMIEDVIEQVVMDNCACSHSPSNSQAAAAQNRAAEQQMMQFLNLCVPGDMQMDSVPDMAQPEIPFDPSILTDFDPSNLPADFMPDLSCLEEMYPDLAGPGSIPMPGGDRVTRDDIQAAQDDLTMGLNAIQGDSANDFGGGLNWGPFTNDKERFDHKVADLRNNPTMENYQELVALAESQGDKLSPSSQRVLQRLEGVVQFLDQNQGQVVDEAIEIGDGINRSEHAVAEEEIRDGVRFLRDNDNHTLSDAGNWGPFTSDKESWDNRLKDFQNAIDDGDLSTAMNHYQELIKTAEGSTNIPAEARDRLLNLEQYIAIAVNDAA